MLNLPDLLVWVVRFSLSIPMQQRDTSNSCSHFDLLPFISSDLHLSHSSSISPSLLCRGDVEDFIQCLCKPHTPSLYDLVSSLFSFLFSPPFIFNISLSLSLYLSPFSLYLSPLSSLSLYLYSLCFSLYFSFFFSFFLSFSLSLYLFSLSLSLSLSIHALPLYSLSLSLSLSPWPSARRRRSLAIWVAKSPVAPTRTDIASDSLAGTHFWLMAFKSQQSPNPLPFENRKSNKPLV